MGRTLTDPEAAAARRVAASTLLGTTALAEALAPLDLGRVEAALDTLDDVVRATRAGRRPGR